MAKNPKYPRGTASPLPPEGGTASGPAKPVPRRSLGWALLAGLVTLGQSAADAAEPVALTVCMAADNAPLSYQAEGQPRGLDVRIAEAAAQALGRPLRVVLFDSDYEKESTLTSEVNALLSAGVCEAASGFPLLRADLGPSQRPSARTPDFPGAVRKRERPYVPLGTLVAGRAYQAAALGLVLPGAVPGVVSLADLATLDDAGARKLGTASGTLASALAMGWRQGALRPRSVALGQRDDPFQALASGRVGALLVPLARFDGWKHLHPQSPLQVTAWRRPIGLNLGFVTLAPAQAAREAIDRVVTTGLADGRLARWAAEEGVSWSPPVAPEVGTGPSLAEVTAD